ncbi:hypothetical protein NQ315_003214 [Exocentrus adspersus]|uniref:Putative nuclease HARBI1 n=1 Tax=Exocentrus adspersus TaxID=1586481 RepID=A0AAV8VM73_9CUCU|nr:hypothetical protein NQ315_003214 [Exocentrus adspersus]
MNNLTSDSEVNSSSSLNTSSDDDEIDFVFRRPKIYKPRITDFNRFRLSKLAVTEVINRIRPEIEKNSNRGASIKAETQVFLTLRYYATGNMLLPVADFVGVSVASASRIIKSVSSTIAALRPEIIQMPQTREELEFTVHKFYEIARFPRCCGAIDCTHVRIISPGGNDGEIYRNRKGYFSLNVQTVADASLKIRNIVAWWPGSCHDQTIFNNSRLKFNFENGGYTLFLLIGDSGYAVQPYLLTPLQTTNTEPERLYSAFL